MIWLALTLAEAAPLEPSLAVAVRAVGETWADTAIGSAYRTGAVMGTGAVLVDVLPWLSADLEVSYRRLTPRDKREARMELVPLSLLAEAWTRSEGGVQTFAGIGPALTLFSEYSADGHDDPALSEAPAETVITGGRLAWEFRGGFRVNTGLIDPPLPPAPQGVLRAAEWEVYLARRMQRPRDEGFRLSAWRVDVGLVFRL